MPDACLSLQNEHGVDVNMLLYCCWVGAVTGKFDDGLFDRAHEFSMRWAGHVVIPLREARTWMKHTGCHEEPMPTDSCMELREDVKTVEFAAEKMQQEVLESLASIDADRDEEPARVVENVSANLMRYLECRDLQAGADVQAKLVVIVRAAFPDINEKIVAETFAS